MVSVVCRSAVNLLVLAVIKPRSVLSAIPKSLATLLIAWSIDPPPANAPSNLASKEVTVSASPVTFPTKES